jgi:hypothetical protein
MIWVLNVQVLGKRKGRICWASNWLLVR